MLQIKTTKLQEMTSKAFKGVGNNKLKPLTMLIAIKVKDNILTLLTTDYENFLYISEPVTSDDFYAVVQANQFVRLISRLTSEDVILDLVDNCLVIKANGSYKIPLEFDVNTGDIVEYPDPFAALSLDKKIGEISVPDIKTILRALKASLATTIAIPQYVNYYIGDKVLATDTNTASCYAKNITSEPILVSSAALDMLDVYAGDDPMGIYLVDDRLIFNSKSCVLVSYVMPGIDSFAVANIDAYLNTAYPSSCKLPKQEILQALDRLSLFVGEFDDDTIAINFKKDGFELSSKQSDSVEVVPYLDSAIVNEMQGFVYLEMFRAQVKAQLGDSVNLHYGEPKSIKFVDSDSNCSNVVCLVTVGK